jgi:hypothetical protein
MITGAFATAAPLESLTVPSIVPLTACAAAQFGKSRNGSRAVAKTVILNIERLPLPLCPATLSGILLNLIPSKSGGQRPLKHEDDRLADSHGAMIPFRDVALNIGRNGSSLDSDQEDWNSFRMLIRRSAASFSSRRPR